MKTIYFVRHAKSSWDDAALSDMDRPLNKRGKHDAPLMAQMLKKKGVKPDHFISSPARRALSTAEIFAEHLGITDIQIEPQIYEAFPEQVLRVVQRIENEHDVVFIFGHNPTFYSLASAFSDTDIDNVPTCGVFVVQAAVDSWGDFDERTGRMVDFYFPKQFS